ncbi:hypothetical protein SDC9_46731 [bioreactor metagenome]|uniref:HTH marR-type domain-containing protein n=1 Tax=bioreactor metagenome TaxID=1076179 RepID=A0A644W9K3_9ZZZZ
MDERREILMTYLRVTQHVSRQFRSHFGQLHLTFPQALVLSVLAASGPMTLGALACETKSANSTISGVVDRLEKLGLARREQSSSDRRITYVSATDKYRALNEETKSDVGDYFASLLDNMSDEDQNMLHGALRMLEKVLDQAEEGDKE